MYVKYSIVIHIVLTYMAEIPVRKWVMIML